MSNPKLCGARPHAESKAIVTRCHCGQYLREFLGYLFCDNMSCPQRPVRLP